jgi:hypothetical protein
MILEKLLGVGTYCLGCGSVSRFDHCFMSWEYVALLGRGFSIFIEGLVGVTEGCNTLEALNENLSYYIIKKLFLQGITLRR